jgi:ATP-dependent Clp protease protease subunit
MSLAKRQTFKFEKPDYIRSEIKTEVLEKWSPQLSVAKNLNTEISIYDQIGADGVSSKLVSSILRNLGGKDVTVAINSPGGDVFDGIAIYNLLSNYEGKVTVKIVGLAASAASIIAMAGDEIQIAKSGFLMIHNVWSFVAGDKNAMKEAATLFAQLDESLSSIYADRTGISQNSISSMMDAETWISGKDAINSKFVDAFLPADEIAESKNPFAIVREVEACLVRSGKTRSEAKQLTSAIRSMRDSVDEVEDKVIAQSDDDKSIDYDTLISFVKNLRSEK